MSEIEVTETENIDYNGSSDCNRCKQTIYWNDSCRNKRSKKKVPLQDPYIPASGISPRAHICKKRDVDANKKISINLYNYNQMHYTCIECAQEYNKLVYPLCPNCWKKRCRNCGNLQSYIYRKAEDLNYCFKCGNEKLDPEHVYSSYKRLYGDRT